MAEPSFRLNEPPMEPYLDGDRVVHATAVRDLHHSHATTNEQRISARPSCLAFTSTSTPLLHYIRCELQGWVSGWKRWFWGSANLDHV